MSIMRGVVLFFSLVLLLTSVMPFTPHQNTVVAQESNVRRTLPATVLRGGTFNATVTFTTPVEVNVVELVDYAPVGWSVEANKSWCSPSSVSAGPKVTGNKVELVWSSAGNYSANTTFTCVYKVTVPQDASSATLENLPFNGTLEYYIGNYNWVEVIEAGGVEEGGPGKWWIIGIGVGIAVIVAVVLVVRRRKPAASAG